MKKLLITGASGFIGNNSFKYAKEYSGYEVIGTRNSTGDKELISCNLLETGACKRLIGITKPDYIIHCAWPMGHGSLNSTLNLEHTKTSIELFNEFYWQGGERAVFLGTCFEYGEYEQVLTEDISLNPLDLYGECKAALGKVLIRTAKLQGVNFSWARLFYQYGLGENEKRLVPYIINTLYKKEVPICSTGEQLRDYLYVKDTASALLTILNYGNGIYNVGSGIPTKLTSVFEILESLLGGKVSRTRSAENEPPLILANVSKLIELGWKQKYSLEDGLKETVDNILKMRDRD